MNAYIDVDWYDGAVLWYIFSDPLEFMILVCCLWAPGLTFTTSTAA